MLPKTLDIVDRAYIIVDGKITPRWEHLQNSSTTKTARDSLFWTQFLLSGRIATSAEKHPGGLMKMYKAQLTQTPQLTQKNVYHNPGYSKHLKC